MLGTLVIAALFQVPASQELSPGTDYDPAIPTLEQVVGHDFQERITPPDQIVRYMRALAEAAPDRTRLIHYATSWEGRPLYMLVIGSAERIARLDEVKDGLGRLADPRGLSSADAARLVSELPVVTALVHGIHGNEISSNGAAMGEAYHLLAARGDEAVDVILRESLVIIDPAENPDGRNRYVMQNGIAEARWPDPATWSAEHDEPWPGGRGNHYLFDLNRDAFIQSQPETRGKLGVFKQFWPHIVADLHEMGGNSTYFFPPTAPPANPWLTPEQMDLMDVVGRGNAAAFDRRGFAYFNRDTYDAFYPGYIDMWPMTHGAMAMTFEQASARALVLRRDDGDLLTYGDGVLHHFTAAIATAETAARNRERILRDYLAFRQSAVELGRRGPAEYVLHSSHDPGMARRLARSLVRNGIEVHEASGPVGVGGRTLPAAGTYLVPAAQPAYRMLRNLLDQHIPMDPEFVTKQIERRANRQRDQIYDVTAWSQSLLWDVEVLESPRATGAAGDRLTLDDPFPAHGEAIQAGGAGPAADGAVLPSARVAYLMPWGTATAAAVAEALREGIRVRSAGGKFTLHGREYAMGTAIVRISDNDSHLAARLGAIAARHEVEVVPVDDSYVRDGISLGSEAVRALREPRVLLVYDAPASSLSAGWARYVLERRYGQRTTVVRASTLGRVLLSEYDVLVFPNGDFGRAVSSALVRRIQDWMRDGGTVITMAGSTAWAADEDVGLLATHAERRGGRAEGTDPPSAKTPDQPIDYLESIAPEDEDPEQVPGAIVRTILDTEHWLSAGTDGEIGVLVEGSRVFSPITLDRGSNVGRYAGLDELVMSGIVWEESKPQLANKAFLIHQPVGRGQIISFAEDPNYRAYAEATELLFMNAVLLGPGR
ncbi:MAG: M14 family zinc carboxypeptidase [Gemmatimonadota bacterium]|nr:M14 family zinc carboxypeptidase [Gemmatimonadota bacterium]MDH5758911.1 M14 family zinc carboxypeptidase [Gemmatimonadota bacterium]